MREHHEVVKRHSRWLTDYLITTAVRSEVNRLVVFGMAEGVLAISILSGCEEIVQGCFHAAVADSPIAGVEWVGLETLGVVAGDESVYLYDVVRDSVQMLAGHSASTKCIRRRDENVFFSGGRDGYAYGWDRRMGKTCHSLHHGRGSVGAVEFSARRSVVVYTACTPGGTVNVWDLRYLRNGLHFSTSQMVGAKALESLVFCRSNLYSVDADGSLFRISEAGQVHEGIHRFQGLASSRLHYDGYLDALLHVSGETLFYTDSRTTHMHRIDGLVGVLPLGLGGILGYDKRGNVSEFGICVYSG